MSAVGAQTFCSSDKSSEVGRQRTAELSNPSTTPTVLITGVGTTLGLAHKYTAGHRYKNCKLDGKEAPQIRLTQNVGINQFSARQMTLNHLVFGNYGGCSSLLSRGIMICSVPINVRPKHDVSV